MEVDEVSKLYFQEGLSCREIGDRLQVSIWKVITFMRKHDIKRRSFSQTRNLQYQRQALSYNKKNSLTLYEQQLYMAGLMIYWGEGAKVDHGVVDFANSDKHMVLIFLEMLRVIYRVKHERLRVLLYCYANQNKSKLQNYWIDLLRIPREQFTKPYVRFDYNSSKLDKMPYGLVHIRYNDKKLLKQIKEDIVIIASKLNSGKCWGGGAVNHT